MINKKMISKLQNILMIDGKKMVSEKILQEVFRIIYYNLKQNGQIIFVNAIKKVEPIIETKKIRLGSTAAKIPTPIKRNRSQFLAIKWLLAEALKNKKLNDHILKYKKNMKNKSSRKHPILDKYNQYNSTLKKKYFKINPHATSTKIANEIMKIHLNKSECLKKKLILHKESEENRSSGFLRWF
jgi:small subunit ribosomal protein S7